MLFQLALPSPHPRGSISVVVVGVPPGVVDGLVFVNVPNPLCPPGLLKPGGVVGAPPPPSPLGPAIAEKAPNTIDKPAAVTIPIVVLRIASLLDNWSERSPAMTNCL